ncbi:DUF2614 family zinc ribbon-containing protein [Polycladospora coralii]|uniref:DUF2614 family zinc ribbon-containing protein n=1 Tax=Polycladospora coralii TaxID=2771432 RepID=UPI0032209713
MLLSGKLNKIRTAALLLVFISIIVMYLGFVWPAVMSIFIALGLILISVSVGIYFWIGVLSTHAPHVMCPVCQKKTKVLGKKDECSHCKAILSLDPNDAPQDKPK